MVIMRAIPNADRTENEHAVQTHDPSYDRGFLKNRTMFEVVIDNEKPNRHETAYDTGDYANPQRRTGYDDCEANSICRERRDQTPPTLPTILRRKLLGGEQQFPIGPHESFPARIAKV